MGQPYWNYLKILKLKDYSHQIPLFKRETVYHCNEGKSSQSSTYASMIPNCQKRHADRQFREFRLQTIVFATRLE